MAANGFKLTSDEKDKQQYLVDESENFWWIKVFFYDENNYCSAQSDMFRLAEKDVTKMRVGAKIEFRVNGIPDKLFKAAIISVGQNIDRLNRATEVYARIIDKDPQFLSGMYVNARIVK